MRVTIYESLDELSNDLISKDQYFSFDQLICQSFPNIFENAGPKSLLQNLFSLPEPQRRGMRYFVLWEDIKVEGFGMLVERDHNSCFVKNLCRNIFNKKTKGYGKLILKSMEKYAFKNQNKKYILIEPDNHKLVHYYYNLGYRLLPLKGEKCYMIKKV